MTRLPVEAERLLLFAQSAKDPRAEFFRWIDADPAEAWVPWGCRPVRDVIINLDPEQLALFYELMRDVLNLDFGDALLMYARCYEVPAAWVLRAELDYYTAEKRRQLLAEAMKNPHFSKELSS